VKLVDFAQASLIGLGNRSLRALNPAEIEWYEKHAGYGVTAVKDGFITLRFYGTDWKGRFFPEWIEDAAGRGARRLRLLTLEDFGESMRLPKGGPTVAARQLAGFANAHETVLGLDFADETVGIRLAMAYPAPTTLTHRDVIDFIAASPESAHFRTAMLWQDEHNLQITDGKDWGRLISSMTPSRDPEFVEAFSSSVSNVAVSAATAARWRALYKERATKLPPELRAIEFKSVPLRPAVRHDKAAAGLGLAAALTACGDYARTKSLDSWSALFDEALGYLNDGAKPARAGSDEVFARLFPRESARLLLAVSRGDVFGAMGSWNDLGLDDDPEYARVSENLFAALKEALAAACNDFSPLSP
jgi:hypothetical protein